MLAVVAVVWCVANRARFGLFVGVATGKHFGATYCNSESLEAAAVAAGKVSGTCAYTPSKPLQA